VAPLRYWTDRSSGANSALPKYLMESARYHGPWWHCRLVLRRRAIQTCAITPSSSNGDVGRAQSYLFPQPGLCLGSGREQRRSGRRLGWNDGARSLSKFLIQILVSGTV